MPLKMKLTTTTKLILQLRPLIPLSSTKLQLRSMQTSLYRLWLAPNSKLPAFHYLKYIISTIYLQQLLTIFQIRNLAKRICNSPTIRADLETQCKEVKIKPRLMIRDVSTRWNSTALMLERALELREALKLLVVMEEHNKPRGVRLSRFKLSKEEWDLLAQLFPILDVRPI